MKKALLVGCAAVALSSVPMLADAAHAQDWTGCYLGVHAGYGWGSDKNTFGKVIDNGSLDVPAEVGPYKHTTSGGLAGGQLGCNYEFEPGWLIGAEGDFSWAGISGRRIVPEDSHDPGSFTAFRSRNRWDGDIAARLGYAFDESLLYGKVGWSWGNFHYLEQHDDFPTTNNSACSPVCTAGFSNTRGGLLFGGGWEFKFADNLSAKIEYNHIDYGSARIPYPSTSNSLALQHFRVSDNENIVKVGINYLFGEEEAPPPPPPPPAPPPPPPPPPVKTFIVFFDFDKSNLTNEAESVVTEAVRTAKSTGMVRVMITGHTDTVGSDAYNQSLSVRRAEAVKDDMVRQGMNGSDIAIEGKSFHDPLVATGPGVREPQNRRAVIDLGGAAT
jgi:outer membrane protein OmpA-like peptidoglycan-associated protein